MATTVGGMDYNERHYRSMLEGNKSGGDISVLDSSDTTEKIAAMFGIRHNITTISTACSSSANAIMLGARLIRNRKLTKVMVGGSDAVLLMPAVTDLLLAKELQCLCLNPKKRLICLGCSARYRGMQM
jgi:3-oxoacyl-[acyl-carrier-protein] synthase-1